MLVREALILDAESMAKLEEALFPDNWMSASTIVNELDRGPAFVAEEDDRILGYAITNWRSNILDLLRIGVTIAHHGRGIGRELLCRVLAVPHNLCVLTVSKTNTRARGLYAAFGFSSYGTTGSNLIMVRKRQRSIPGRSWST